MHIALASTSSGVTLTSVNSRSDLSRSTSSIVAVASTVIHSGTWGAVNAEATMACALSVRTPLIGWPQVTESQRKELDYFNIRTVEQLASVADGFASNMMGVQALKQAAQKFIAQSKDSAIVNKLNTELAQRDTLLAGMQEQMALMAEKLAAIEAEKGTKSAPKGSKGS